MIVSPSKNIIIIYENVRKFDRDIKEFVNVPINIELVTYIEKDMFKIDRYPDIYEIRFCFGPGNYVKIWTFENEDERDENFDSLIGKKITYP